MNNNKNNNNKKLDIASKILLVIIILSFVFSAVALGRSCSVSSASADEINPYQDYAINLVEVDNISNTENVYRFNSNYSELVYFSSFPSSLKVIFGQSFYTVERNSENGRFRVLNSSNGVVRTWFVWDNFLGDSPIFSFREFSGYASEYNITYELTSYTPISMYRVVYYPLTFSTNGNVDYRNSYDVFSSAVATYSFESNVSGVNSVSVSAPVDIDITSNRVYFDTLYNLIPDYVIQFDFSVTNNVLSANEYLIIEFPLVELDVSNIVLSFFPLNFDNGWNILNVTNDNSPVGFYVYNYLGLISPFSDTVGYVRSCNRIVIPTTVNNGFYTGSFASYLKTSFFTYGSVYDMAFASGYSSAKGEDTRIYAQGFEAGKIEGASTANEYTFFGLISAVVDAPIQAVTGLLNFTFLGVNLFAFFTGLLTVALILFIVKKILGG